MNWIRRTLLLVLVAIVAIACVATWTAQRTARPVGFEIAHATDSEGKPLVIAVWYPTRQPPWPTTLLGVTLMDVARSAPVDGRDLPLVIVSHGDGGGPGSHADLALALAGAGYVVAAPVHSGDNYEDERGLSSPTFLHDRTGQLHAALDYMLTGWRGHDRVDTHRIGAFGFSAGGFTVLTAIGAKPDLRTILPTCTTAPEFVCAVLRAAKSPLLDPGTQQTDGSFVADPRIQAAVVAAPGLGFTLAADGLANVHVPVQLWTGDADRTVPYATNGAIVRAGLGALVEFHPVLGASHDSFLAPCHLLAPSSICSDPGKFDRSAFHAQMDARVVAFFDQHLDHRRVKAAAP